MKTIKQLAVIGTGVMGMGITQLIIQAGFPVVWVARSQTSMDRAMKNLKGSYKKLVETEKMTKQQMDATLKRIKEAVAFEEVKKVDLVIEAVPENLELKQEIFAKLDKGCLPTAILATNTSSIPISLIASATKRPDRVIGTHFFNPVLVMKGVELVRGRLTSQETIETCLAFIKKLDKRPIVALDYAGFITTRLIVPYLNEAAHAVAQGNDPKDVDEAMLYCMNMPMGPCALMDHIGIDVVVQASDMLTSEFDNRFKAPPLLRQMVRAGQLGKKTSQGFFKYSEE